MRTHLLLVGAAAIAICAMAMATTVTSQEDQWIPLPAVDAPLVQELGGWVVAEHDRRANDKVRFIRVVSGQEMEDTKLSGVRYHFVIDAFDGSGRPAKYDAVLADIVWQNRRVFISFNPAR
ncbi:hypothetical protein HU200_022624 [Digitaria exilis]|uniref:Cystatin domain-containing protein n=1 Tax=Digitaria exilis TaxID=1010633 RepID=A0A835EXD3_9POAL|nr:hypothetical protein HU200_022624 [Digitaria exilis]